MAGRPKRRAFLAKMAAIGGEELVLEMVANGQPLVSIAEELGTSRYLLWLFLNKGPAERKHRYKEALKVGASVKAEEAQEIADNANELTPGGVQKAKLRSDVRRWLAGVYDRETFGSEAAQGGGGGNVFNIKELHLQALQQRGGPEVQAGEFRVLSDGESEREDAQ